MKYSQKLFFLSFFFPFFFLKQHLQNENTEGIITKECWVEMSWEKEREKGIQAFVYELPMTISLQRFKAAGYIRKMCIKQRAHVMKRCSLPNDLQIQTVNSIALKPNYCSSLVHGSISHTCLYLNLCPQAKVTCKPPPIQ